MTKKPTALIIGGPNGAGKSTFASILIPEPIVFLNADEIAKSLPADHEHKDREAGRMFLQRLDKLAESKTDFAIETTLSSKSLAPRIRRWKVLGYRVHLRFVWVPDVHMSINRVAGRVQMGGHNIPSDVIRRRYFAGWRNFHELYKPLVHTWRVYANIGESGPDLIAEGHDNEITVYREELWLRFSHYKR